MDLDLDLDLQPKIIDLLSTIQYQMESQYQETSMLTNLFTEHKFWGWSGLFLIFTSICGILFFQVLSWEEEDKEREGRK